MRSLAARIAVRRPLFVFATLLGIAAALPAAAQGGGPTQVTLSWMQPPASAPVEEFRVYKGPSPTGPGTLAYADLPSPDPQGVYQATVEVGEIDQGIPTYVWLTAWNSFGESPPSTANLYPEGCDPDLDSDCDGVVDDGAPGFAPCATGQSQGCDDNCPYWPNPGQEDGGGIGASASVPDGIGDACQCGDVSGDGRVNIVDAVIYQRSLLMPPTAAMARPELCDVGASLGCNLADAVILKRALATPPRATIAQQCDPAVAP